MVGPRAAHGTQLRQFAVVFSSKNLTFLRHRRRPFDQGTAQLGGHIGDDVDRRGRQSQYLPRVRLRLGFKECNGLCGSAQSSSECSELPRRHLPKFHARSQALQIPDLTEHSGKLPSQPRMHDEKLDAIELSSNGGHVSHRRQQGAAH